MTDEVKHTIFTVNDESCTGCGSCVAACPMHILAIIESRCSMTDSLLCLRFERHLFTSRLEPGRKAMVIGTWGYPGIDTYDHVIENIITILNLHKVETVEAISACGFEGLRHGLDTRRRGVIAHYPKQLKKAYLAGKSLAR